MYLRTVFGSRPARRAIAVIDNPCRWSSKIIISSPSWITAAAPLQLGSEGMVSDGRTAWPAGGLPRQARPGCQLGNFRCPQMRNSTPSDSLTTSRLRRAISSCSGFIRPWPGKASCGSSANAFTQLRSCVGCTFRSCDACAYETPRSLISRTASSLNSRVNLRLSKPGAGHPSLLIAQTTCDLM